MSGRFVLATCLAATSLLGFSGCYTTSPSAETADAPTGSPLDVPPQGPVVKVHFAATTENFPNPDRGFYGWSGDDLVANYDADSVAAAYAAGQRLVLGSISLQNFRTRDLTPDWLAALDSRLAALRTAGVKTALLFAYDFTEGGNDATAAQIKRHVEQLKPVLAANADVIPYMRAGFVGAWGEWHSSQAGNSCGYNAGNTSCAVANANRVIIRDALLANVPATTQIDFRLPIDLQTWYPSPTQQQRVGVHNDCFLADADDNGTYADQAARDYVKALSADTAFGGETCDYAGAAVRSTCADIRREGAQYHLAWLNVAYSPTFINAWKNGGCYEEVARTMGYRVQLDALAHPERSTRGSTADIAVELRNVGWARMFSPRKLVVSLKHKASGAIITAAAGDLRSLVSQAESSTTVTVAVAIPTDAALGEYDIFLSAPDGFAKTSNDARFAARFANSDDAALGQTWDSDSAAFKVGSTLAVE